MNQPKIGLSLNHKGWGIVTDQKAGTGRQGLFSISGVWRADNSAARGTELRQIWLEHHFSYKALVTVPVLDLFWSVLEIPPVPETEILSTIRATWDLLEGNERYLLAYQVLERGEKIRLRVGAIGAEEIKNWLEVIESAGIELEGLILQAQAVAQALLQQDMPAIFVNIMDAMIEMGIAQSGVPLQLRTFPWNTRDVDEVKEAVSFTLHAWAMSHSDLPDELIILQSDNKETGEELLTGWGDLNVRLFNQNDYYQGELSLNSAFGAYTSWNNPGVIWHPRIAAVELRERTKTLLFSAMALVIFIIGSLFFYRAHIIKNEVRNEWVKENLPLYRNLNAIISEDEHFEARLSAQRDQWEKRNIYTYYLDRWYKTVPPGTVLSSWTMDGMRVLEISGRTPSAPKLLEELGKDRVFAKLTISGPIYRNPKGWDEFRLSGRLIKEVTDEDENRTGE